MIYVFAQLRTKIGGGLRMTLTLKLLKLRDAIHHHIPFLPPRAERSPSASPHIHRREQDEHRKAL